MWKRLGLSNVVNVSVGKYLFRLVLRCQMRDCHIKCGTERIFERVSDSVSSAIKVF